MAGDPTNRLAWKEPLHSLQVELQRDYGLSAISSRALLRRLEVFVEQQLGDTRQHGQICYPAVALGERAGKPLRLCLTVPTLLTMVHADDADVLHQEGSPALRRVRLARLAAEAHRQGAVLSHEDLALLLALDASSVRRVARDCAAEGQRPPTRGVVEDIGPSLSHKDHVLRLFFRGLLPARIAARTGHSLGSVERYLSDFARVAALHRRGVSRPASVRILGMSPSLVDRYLALLDELDTPGHRAVLDRLLVRFGPIDDEVSDG